MSKARDYLQQLDEEFATSAEGYGYQLRLDLAEILWRTLKLRGWSQTEFAEKSGWADSFVSNLVHANQNCELDTVGKALHVLGVRAQLQLAPESHWSRIRLTEGHTSTRICTEGRHNEEESQEEGKIQFWTNETPAPSTAGISQGTEPGRYGAFDLRRREVAVG